MKQVTRTTLRNVARNPLRAALMVSLLAVGISLALIMFTVDSAFADLILEMEDGRVIREHSGKRTQVAS